MKRAFDIFAAIFGILLWLPFGIIISILIVLGGGGGVFYTQTRVGRNNQDFQLLKFRTMISGADKTGQLTVGARDSRITKIGYFLRKFKLDEIPQFINILKGEMSFVGPRPEVRKYVDMYNEDQLKVLNVRPGLTDYASLEYINENEILGKAEDPEKTYIEEIMPAKLKLNMKYIDETGLGTDIKIIFRTIGKIFS